MANHLIVLLIDKDNMIRNQYFAFLNNNFISDLMVTFGVDRYNVTASSWLMFSAIIIVAVMMLVGNIVAPKFVDKQVADNYDMFSSEKKVRVFFSILFYGALFLIAAVIILLAYFIGHSVFSVLFSANEEETSPFLSLLIMLSIFLPILLAIPVVILIIYAIIKALVLLFKAIFCKKSKGQKIAEEEKALPAEEVAPAEETETLKQEPIKESLVTEDVDASKVVDAFYGLLQQDIPPKKAKEMVMKEMPNVDGSALEESLMREDVRPKDRNNKPKTRLEQYAREFRDLAGYAYNEQLTEEKIKYDNWLVKKVANRNYVPTAKLKEELLKDINNEN